MKGLGEALRQLGFEPDRDFLVRDDGDRRGPYIAEWLSERAQPSEAEIAEAAASASAADARRQAERQLAATDAGMARHVEHVWAAVKRAMAKGRPVTDADLPIDTRALLEARAALRAQIDTPPAGDGSSQPV